MADGSDIVKRLRERSKFYEPTQLRDMECILAEAAAEIERLRAQAPGWRGMETVPMDEEKSFLVLLPKNDVAPFVVLQVSRFEGRLYPDARNACIDWDDGITTATHWQPLPSPPAEGGK